MSEPYIGQLMCVGYSFSIRGWANCDGQILPTSQHSALFSLFGTTYGGDGESTFGLPDLRGRVPVHAGQGPDLPVYTQGEKGGRAGAIRSDEVNYSVRTQAYLVMRWLVALQGIYPSAS